jgi:nucleotide-binding universal stress UspA family protein
MFSKVIVGVDGREGGRDAIALARRLSAPDAQITLAHVYGDAVLGRGSGLLLVIEREEAEQLLARERDAASLDATLVPLLAPAVGRGLHVLAGQRNADLIVVGSSRRGRIGRLLIGDDARGALNRSHCPVGIAPHGYEATAARFSTIGVGYDGSPESEQALAAARALAVPAGARVRAMAVVSMQSIPYGEPVKEHWPEAARRLMDPELRRQNGLEEVEGDVSYGQPGTQLERFAEGLDLLAVGSRSYGPVGRLLIGSTSNYLARHASCPLLVLPRRASTSIQADAAGNTETPIAAFG